MVDGPDRQERRNRDLSVGIGQEQQPGAAPHSVLRLPREPPAGGREPLSLLESHVEGEGPQTGERGGEDEEALELGQARAVRRLRQEGRARAEQRSQRHHVALPQVVDGRIGDLREPLPQVRVDGTRAPGERRQGRVVAHRGDRLVAAAGDRPQDDRQLLAGVAGSHLPRCQIVLRRRQRRSGVDLDEVPPQPAAVRLPGRETPLDLAVRLHPAARGVDGDHLARAELPTPDAPALDRVERAGLRRADDEAVVAHGDPQRSQAVAVERGADDAAVGEDEPGRPVPGLDEARVVAVERADVVVELPVVLPCLRDEHRERVAHVAAAADEQLERVVEHRRVGAGLVEHRSEHGVELAFPRPHPGQVALDRVDLAVVREQAEGLRPFPGRRRVRREALVEDGERRGEGRVAQVRVEGRELIRRAERLVGDRAERERADVGAVVALGSLPRSIGPLLGLLETGAERPAHDDLLDPRGRGAGGVAERRGVDRHLAPAEHLEPLRSARGLDALARAVVAQEDHPEPAPRGRQERRRKREQQPRAVAAEPVGGHGPAMADAPERLERVVDDVAARPAGRVRDEPDAAGIALAHGVVERPEGHGTSRGQRGRLPPQLSS